MSGREITGSRVQTQINQDNKSSPAVFKPNLLVLEYFYNDIHHHYFGCFIPRESCKLLPR